MCWHTELLPVTLVSLWLPFNEVTPLRHLPWKPGKVSILGFFCFCFWKLEPPLFLTFFYLSKIEWVMAFVLLCTHFAPPKCLTILCSDGAHTMLGTFIWQFILSSVHTWAHHSSAFVATCAAHTLLGIVTQSFISASVHFQNQLVYTVYMCQHFTIPHPALNEGCGEIILIRIMKHTLCLELLGTGPSPHSVKRRNCWEQMPALNPNKQTNIALMSTIPLQHFLFFNKCARL